MNTTSPRKKTFIGIVLMKIMRKNMLHTHTCTVSRAAAVKEQRETGDAQELRGHLLQAHREVEYDGIDKLCCERDWDIEERECNALNEQVVDHGLLVAVNNWVLHVQHSDLHHGKKRAKGEQTVCRGESASDAVQLD